MPRPAPGAAVAAGGRRLLQDLFSGVDGTQPAPAAPRASTPPPVVKTPPAAPIETPAPERPRPPSFPQVLKCM